MRRRLVAAAFAYVVGPGCGPGAAPESSKSAAPVPEPRAAAAEPAPAQDGAEQTDVRHKPEPRPHQIPEGKLIVSLSSLRGLVAFTDERTRRGAMWTGPLGGNGGRDVVIYIPPPAKPSAEIAIVYHFHGTYSERIQKKASGVPKKEWVGWDRLGQTLDAADALQAARDYNVALIYPISAGKRLEPGHKGWSNRAYDQMWMRPDSAPGYTDDFGRLHEEVMAVLVDQLGVEEQRVRPKVMAQGHSAGGIALLNVALSGTKRVAEYVFLDAGFRGWADGCHAAIRKAKAGAKITLVITDRGIADPFGKRDPWCVTSEAQAGQWKAHETWCQTHSGAPAGAELDCGDLQFVAEQWSQTWETWCASMREDMRDVPDVYVHRTKVPHGKQPSHFTGGLELPAARFDPSG